MLCVYVYICMCFLYVNLFLLNLPANKDDVIESPSSLSHEVTLIKSFNPPIDTPGVDDDEPELRWHLSTAVLPLITNWS